MVDIFVVERCNFVGLTMSFVVVKIPFCSLQITFCRLKNDIFGFENVILWPPRQEDFWEQEYPLYGPTEVVIMRV